MGEPGFAHHVTARIWEFVRPVARGERYEDRLQAAVATQRLGLVLGGESQVGQDSGSRSGRRARSRPGGTYQCIPRFTSTGQMQSTYTLSWNPFFSRIRSARTLAS